MCLKQACTLVVACLSKVIEEAFGAYVKYEFKKTVTTSSPADVRGRPQRYFWLSFVISSFQLLHRCGDIHARTHTHTHARTHSRTHARTRAHEACAHALTLTHLTLIPPLAHAHQHQHPHPHPNLNPHPHAPTRIRKRVRKHPPTTPVLAHTQ